MTTHRYASFGSHEGHLSPTDLLKQCLSGILSCAQGIGRRMEERRARRELHDLPDTMLADLGISRSEVASVVRYGRSDPTRLPRGRA